MRQKKPAPCYVYLIGRTSDDGLSGPIKIGISDHPGRRLASLQTASPHRLAVIAAIMMPSRKAARQIEGVMHETLGDDAMHGEWFDITPFNAVGMLCEITRMYLVAIGGEGDGLAEVLEWSGATDLAQRWMAENAQRTQ